jgi:hypothetical protein
MESRLLAQISMARYVVWSDKKRQNMKREESAMPIDGAPHRNLCSQLAWLAVPV